MRNANQHILQPCWKCVLSLILSQTSKHGLLDVGPHRQTMIAVVVSDVCIDMTRFEFGSWMLYGNAVFHRPAAVPEPTVESELGKAPHTSLPVFMAHGRKLVGGSGDQSCQRPRARY